MGTESTRAFVWVPSPIRAIPRQPNPYCLGPRHTHTPHQRAALVGGFPHSWQTSRASSQSPGFPKHLPCPGPSDAKDCRTPLYPEGVSIEDT